MNLASFIGLFSSSSKKSKLSASLAKRRLRLESLESREMLSVSPLSIPTAETDTAIVQTAMYSIQSTDNIATPIPTSMYNTRETACDLGPVGSFTLMNFLAYEDNGMMMLESPGQELWFRYEVTDFADPNDIMGGYSIQVQTGGWVDFYSEDGKLLGGNWNYDGMTGLVTYTPGIYYLHISVPKGSDVSTNPGFILMALPTTVAPKLDAPTLDSVTVTGSTSIDVSWTSPANATRVTIQYSTSSNFDSDVKTATATGTQHSLTGLEGDTTYYVRIKATASKYKDSDYTTAMSVTTDYLPPLAQPVITSVSATATKIRIEGDFPENASYMKVEYSTSATFDTIDSQKYWYPSAGNTFESPALTAETTYYVRITASATGFKSSVYSVPITVTTKAAEAQSFVVTTLDDVIDDSDGLTSLREALAYADELARIYVLNDDPYHFTITFDQSLADQTIVLNGKPLEIKYGHTIDASGMNITIDADQRSGVIKIGGATYIRSDLISLVGLTITGASSDVYGAIDVSGYLTSNKARLSVVNCMIVDNMTHGVYVSFGATRVNIVNSTISGNSKYGIYVMSDDSTVVTLTNSIVAKNNDNDISRFLYETIQGHNSITSFTGWTGDSGDNYVYDGSKPLFVDAENGDYSLADDSQAIDKGNNSYAVGLAMDIIGNDRIFNGTIDVGAYEYNDIVVAPKAPENFRSTNQGANSVTLSCKVQSKLTGYTLQYKKSSDSDWTTWPTAPEVAANSATISGLDAETEYDFQLTATNAVGSESSTTSATTAAAVSDPPVAPVDFTSTARTQNSVTLSWTAQDNLTGYTLQYKTTTALDWTTQSPSPSIVATEATITGLEAGMTYEFLLTATNAFGSAEATMIATTMSDVTLTSTHVTTALDVVDDADGVVSFREALLAAKSGDTITFAEELRGQTIFLDTSKYACWTIVGDITIDADGMDITLDANGGCNPSTSYYRGIENYGTSKIIGLTITGLNGNLMPQNQSGAIYNRGDLTLINCRVVGNADGINNRKAMTLINTLVGGNYFAGIRNEGTNFISLTIINSTIVDGFGVPTYFYGPTIDWTIMNSIITNLTVQPDYPIYRSIDIYNSLICGTSGNFEECGFVHVDENSLVGDGWTPISAKFVKYTPAIGPYGWSKTLWQSWDLRLQDTSPALNAGSNDYVPDGITKDLAGNARIIDETADMGAYEKEAAAPLLDAPANLRSTQTAQTTVSLQWNAVEGATQYILECKVPEWNDFVMLYSGTEAKCVIRYLAPGTDYQFRVQAVGSAFSEAITVTTASNELNGNPVTDSPAIISCGVKDGEATITWTNLGEDYSYTVYRAGRIVESSFKGNSFTDLDPAAIGEYAVRAFSSVTQKSSTIATTIVWNTVRPIDFIGYEISSNGVKLYWNVEPDMTYQVMRAGKILASNLATNEWTDTDPKTDNAYVLVATYQEFDAVLNRTVTRRTYSNAFQVKTTALLSALDAVWSDTSFLEFTM